MHLIEDLDQDTRLRFIFTDVVAYDPETRISLTRSRGRRRTGRPARYTLWQPDGTFHREWLNRFVTPDNPKGEGLVEGESRIAHLTAHSDVEAVVKAQRVLARAVVQP